MRETYDPEKPNLVFHYNRERRLEHAPESVRRAYENGPAQRPGLIRGLVATPALRSIFFVIILLSVIITGITLFGAPEGYTDLDGVPVRLRSFYFDEQVYYTVTLSGTARTEAIAVDLQVSALDEADTLLAEQSQNGIYTGEKLVLRGVFPDTGIANVTVQIRSGETLATTRSTVDRK